MRSLLPKCDILGLSIVPVMERVQSFCYLVASLCYFWMVSKLFISSKTKTKTFWFGPFGSMLPLIKVKASTNNVSDGFRAFDAGLVFHVFISWFFAGGPLLNMGPGGHWLGKILPIFSKHFFSSLNMFFCWCLFFFTPYEFIFKTFMFCTFLGMDYMIVCLMWIH